MVSAERAFLESLQAGCIAPVAARAAFGGGRLRFRGRCLKPDGRRVIEVSGEDAAEHADALGRAMADEARRLGFTTSEWRPGGSR
jgi:hydroxymethylbilane synthase